MEKGLQPHENGILIAEAHEPSANHHFTILSARNQVEDKDGNHHVVLNFKAVMEYLSAWQRDKERPKSLEKKYTESDLAAARIDAWHAFIGNHAVMPNMQKILKDFCSDCGGK